MNNGPRKGGQASVFETLRKSPGLEDIWQGHRSLLDADPTHNTSPDMIANLEEGAADQAYTITAAVSADGTFTVTNARNGFTKTYRKSAAAGRASSD